MTRAEALAELDKVIWDPNQEDRIARYEKLKKDLHGYNRAPNVTACAIHGEITAMEMMKRDGAKMAVERLKLDLVRKLAMELVNSPALQVTECRAFDRDVLEIDMLVRVVNP